MASVHPSRLGLVPQASSSFRDGGRDRDRDRERGRDRDAEYRSSLRRDDGRERERGRGGDIDGRRRGRSSSPPNEKAGTHDEDRRTHERDERPRRRSPDYSSYRREEPPHIADANDNANTVGASAPRRAPENMYASRGGGGPRGGGYGAAGGDDYFASRRLERASKQVNIWPPSPKAPSRDLNDSKKKRSSKRRRSSSVLPSSEDERERRRRKEKKRKEKARDRDDREERHKKHRRERSYDDDSEDDRRHRRRRGYSRRSDESNDDERRSRSRSKSEKRREKSSHKSRHSSHADTPPRSHAGEDEAEWVEKPADSFVAVAEHSGKEPHMETTTKGEKIAMDDSDSDEVGPQPAPRATNTGKKVDERAYGGALLRGEGSAMAAFLQDGDTDARIPRRGEIGLTPEEIATFESVGYVMSGSRHRRMNAVRMRKENQVISAEEKRGILKLQKEERERREAILREEFRELVQENLKGTGSSMPDVREEE